MKLNSFVWRTVLSLIVLAAAVPAKAQFNYNGGDLLICFRKTVSAANDLVVDVGPVSAFVNLGIGQQIAISNYYTSSQLSSVGTNSVAWSAFASDRSGIPFVANIWVTRPRTSFNTQTAPWNARSASSQGPTAGIFDAVGQDANTLGSELPGGINNTTNVLVEPESHTTPGDASYKYYVTSTGDFGIYSVGGVVEQTTGAGFTASAQNVRADFYQLLSTNSNPAYNPAVPVKYLGFFEFATNGVLTYTSGPSSASITPPVITSFIRAGTTNTVTFTTGSSGTYSLRGTNSTGLLAPRTSWPVISSVAGNGSPQSLMDVNTNGQTFYLISAQ